MLYTAAAQACAPCPPMVAVIAAVVVAPIGATGWSSPIHAPLDGKPDNPAMQHPTPTRVKPKHHPHTLAEL